MGKLTSAKRLEKHVVRDKVVVMVQEIVVVVQQVDVDLVQMGLLN